MPAKALPPADRLRDLAREWSDGLLAERGLSRATHDSYSRDVGVFLSFLKKLYGTGPCCPGPSDMDLFLAEQRSRGLQSRSLAHCLSSVRSFFRFLMDRGAADTNPAADEENPKLPMRLPNFLTREEMDRVLKAPSPDTPSGRRDRAVLGLLYAAGLRVSELCGMQTDDFDQARGVVRVMGKGRKQRYVPVHAAMREELISYLAKTRPCFSPKTDSLFVSRRGLPLTRQYVWKMVRKAALLAGITHRVSPHTFRHSWKAARICAACRCCSGTLTSRPPKSTPMCRLDASWTFTTDSTQGAGLEHTRLREEGGSGFHAHGHADHLPQQRGLRRPRRHVRSGPHLRSL